MRRPLPSLCLEKIFWAIHNENVIDDDPLSTLINIRKTLFNCLLVNRDFCRHVVPILWRNTFNWYLPSSNLVISYLCFLSPEARSTLSQRLDIDIRGLLDSCSKKRPFFNYASYLRELEYHSAFKSVQRLWPDQNQQHVDYQLILLEELCKMFLSQSPALYRLDLATDLNFNNHFNFTPIPLYPFAKSCLVRLREFKCSNHPDQLKLFSTLSNICHNIEVMQLSIFHDSDQSLYEAIRQLIISQRYLRKFIFSFAQKGFMSVIGPAFLAKSTSLQDVILHACDFLDDENPFASLVHCNNLSSLILVDCKNLQGSHLSPLILSNIRMPRRTTLRLNIKYNYPLQYSDIKSIITHGNVLLTKLLLDDIIQPPSSFIEQISTHCPNLTHFRANISASNLPQIPLLFKSLKKLEIIELNNEKTYYENLVPITISNELAIDISESIPNSLYSFTFLMMVVFTSQSLSLFLEQLDKRFFTMSDYDDDDEMNVVIFEEFSVRINFVEWIRDKESDGNIKLFKEFECTRYLDDRNCKVVPTYIEGIDDDW